MVDFAGSALQASEVLGRKKARSVAAASRELQGWHSGGSGGMFALLTIGCYAEQHPVAVFVKSAGSRYTVCTCTFVSTAEADRACRGRSCVAWARGELLRRA